MEIVGLKNFVQDDVNKLIAKFVGFQSKVAKELKEEKRKWADENCLTDKGVENYLITFPGWLKGNARVKFTRVIFTESYKFKKLQTFDERQEFIIQLTPWKRKFLLMMEWRHLYPRKWQTSKNLKFLNEQILELGFKNSIPSWDFRGTLNW